MALDDVIAMGRHTILETTLRRPALVVNTIDRFRAAGYGVRLFIVTCHPRTSWLATQVRYWTMHSAVGWGRSVPMAHHDLCAARLAQHMREVTMRRDDLDVALIGVEPHQRWRWNPPPPTTVQRRIHGIISPNASDELGPVETDRNRTMLFALKQMEDRPRGRGGRRR